MTPQQLLDRALLHDPARPLLTFYDDATGERSELSVTTFANWVAKTANLLQDGLGAARGQVVAIHLPAHWQAAVWLSACWATGAVAAPLASHGDVAVIAADAPGPPPDADEVVGLGLGPMGLPRRGATPPAYVTLDFDADVHSHGDRFLPHDAVADHWPALRTGAETLTAGELGEAATTAADRWNVRPGGRLLCAEPLAGLPEILAALLVPLATEAGAVLCRNLDPARLPNRVEAEHVVAALGPTAARIPGIVQL